MAAEHLARCPAPRGGRFALGQHVYGRPRLACRRPRLAKEPDLVRDGCGGAQTREWHRRRHRSGRGREKGLIERAYTLGTPLGLEVWCQDEAGPFQTVPHPGHGWTPKGQPATQPHEYIRGGTCKILTLFHPATGRVRVRPAVRCTNTILHGWLREELTAIVAVSPASADLVDEETTRAAWRVWQEGLTERFTLPDPLPPLRVLLVWDNLAGHKSADMVTWLCEHGVMPLYTPPGGSWLNMAGSIQRILKRRALDGHHPGTSAGIGVWFEQTARAWNQDPTPFAWNGKRRQRRRKRSGDRHAVGGSAAYTRQPLTKRCPLTS